MDTILFFYRKKGLREPEIEPVGLKTYLLIRIGLDVDAGIRKTESADGDAPEEGRPSLGTERQRHGPDGNPYRLGAVLCHPWRTFQQNREKREQQRRERAYRRKMEQEEARRLAERERLLAETEAAIRKLASELEELADGWRDCYCVYEDSVRKAVMEEVLWRKYFPIEEFSGYRQQFWVEQLFPKAIWPHFIILGRADGVLPVIEACARRMKSLRWILTEAEYDEELAAFVEDFYTEYGLAVELQLLEDAVALKRLRFFCKEAVNIVDFTGEAYMAVSAVPEGSIWLDMLSVEEKRRRIMARGKKITYFSMKEIWKSAQKRCNCPRLP